MNMYEEYQLQWMIGHKYSLKELMEELDKYQNDPDEPLTVTELFSRWEKDAGFGSDAVVYVFARTFDLADVQAIVLNGTEYPLSA